MNLDPSARKLTLHQETLRILNLSTNKKPNKTVPTCEINSCVFACIPPTDTCGVQ